MSQLSIGNICNISRTEVITCKSSAHTDLVQLECKYFRNNSTNRAASALRTEYVRWNYWSIWNNNILYNWLLGLAHKVPITLWNVNCCTWQWRTIISYTSQWYRVLVLPWCKQILCSGKEGRSNQSRTSVFKAVSMMLVIIHFNLGYFGFTAKNLTHK